MEHSRSIREVPHHVLLALVTCGFVQGPFTGDNSKVFLRICNCTGLVPVRTVGRPDDGCAVFLASPAKVGHGLHVPDR